MWTGARQRLVGYCPQFDALIGQMTVRETLWMYARLRGIYTADIGRVVDKLIDQLTLDKYADRQAGRLRYSATYPNSSDIGRISYIRIYLCYFCFR